MYESKIFGLFPIPVYSTELNRKLTKKELLFVENCKKNSYKNEGNTTSNDTYILNNKAFTGLKNQLNIIIKDYFDKIVCDDNLKPYITQSWLNYTNKNQYHHTHRHPNSFVSGVFYIDADENNDKIKFWKDGYSAIQPDPKEYNLYNSTSWWFNVKSCQVILFPSSLTHCVEVKEGTNTRISLAFNVFVKGKIGNERNLTELIL